MRVVPRRAANREAHIEPVLVWSVDAVGANFMDNIYARNGAQLAGFNAPNPAGWGLAGSDEATDSTVWASPQAFTGGGSQVALSTLTAGAAKPTVYPSGDSTTTNVVLPGRGGF